MAVPVGMRYRVQYRRDLLAVKKKWYRANSLPYDHKLANLKKALDGEDIKSIVQVRDFVVSF